MRRKVIHCPQDRLIISLFRINCPFYAHQRASTVNGWRHTEIRTYWRIEQIKLWQPQNLKIRFKNMKSESTTIHRIHRDRINAEQNISL